MVIREVLVCTTFCVTGGVGLARGAGVFVGVFLAVCVDAAFD